MMTASVVLIAIAALGRFFVSYCRSLLAMHGAMEVSEQAREVAGLGSGACDASDFKRLVLLGRLCPEPKGDRVGVQAVAAYYRVLDLLHAMFRTRDPRLADWTERERMRCTHFAAVMFGRRIAYSRAFWAEQPD